jgi:purine-binding chemotaxis protein CheW
MSSQLQDAGKEKASGKANKDISKYLKVLIADTDFVINIHDIREIIEYPDVTAVPKSPDYMHGVINLRGNYIPVVDLGGRIYNQPSEIDRFTCIIIIVSELEDGPHAIGVLVNKVNQFIEVTSDSIQMPPTFGTRIKPEYIERIIKYSNDHIMQLNFKTVLDLKELTIKVS